MAKKIVKKEAKENNKIEEVQDNISKEKKEKVVKIEEIVKEFNELSDEINEKLNTLDKPEDLEATVNEELKKLDDISEKVNKREVSLKEEVMNTDNEPLKRQFGRRFGEFWSGVSNGWDN